MYCGNITHPTSSTFLFLLILQATSDEKRSCLFTICRRYWPGRFQTSPSDSDAFGTSRDFLFSPEMGTSHCGNHTTSQWTRSKARSIAGLISSRYFTWLVFSFTRPAAYQFLQALARQYFLNRFTFSSQKKGSVSVDVVFRANCFFLSAKFGGSKWWLQDFACHDNPTS